MSKYMVRVELENATEKDYESVRTDLQERGFSRLIPAGDGGHYILPSNEYSLDAGWTPDQVLNAVKTVAGSTHRKHAILVTESLSRKWHGLEEEKY